MMAVKQMSVQEKDTGTLQTICDEIGIFQKVSHENIVQFHGLEVHHVRQSYNTSVNLHVLLYAKFEFTYLSVCVLMCFGCFVLICVCDSAQPAELPR